MNELKYIIVVPPGFNREVGARAIIFNGMVTHSTMVPPEFEVISAGFMILQVQGKNLRPRCYGESTSLELKSNPTFDGNIVGRTLSRKHPRMGFMK